MIPQMMRVHLGSLSLPGLMVGAKFLWALVLSLGSWSFLDLLSVISTSLKCSSGVCETAVLAAAGCEGDRICFLASAVVLELNQSPVCMFGFGG